MREVTDFPHQSTSPTKARQNTLHHQHKMRDKYLKSRAIDSAVAAIQRGEFTDYANAAKKYKCSRIAVSWRVRGLTETKQEANSFWHQCLIIKQEEVLIDRINYLIDRQMPPTSYIIRNLAEEIRGPRVGKN